MRTFKGGSLRVTREPLTEQAKRILRSAILNGQFNPGARLVETALAERYGITRHVMRAALQALEGEGLVANDPFRGRSVISPGRRDYESIYLIRVSLESLAAGLAAYRITSDLAAALLEHGRLPPGPPEEFSAWVEWDTGIHRKIWEIADEPLLTSHLERLIWPFMTASPINPLGNRDQDSLVRRQIEREQSGHPASHVPLLRAICARDPAAARQAMLEHLFPSGEAQVSRETARRIATVLGLQHD